jgi:hypothetical protein
MDLEGALPGGGKDATLLELGKGRPENGLDRVEPFSGWCVLSIVMISHGEGCAVR